MSLRDRWQALRGRVAPGPRAWVGGRRGVLLVALGIFVAAVWPLFAVPSFNWTAVIPILLLPLVASLSPCSPTRTPKPSGTSWLEAGVGRCS
jgi:hypothetical protein